MALFHTKNGFLDAAATGDLALLKEYLAIKETNWCGVKEKKTAESALQKAARKGHLEAVRLLMAEHDTRQYWDSGSYAASLTAAVVNGRTEIVRLLLSNKNFVDRISKMPVNEAISADCQDILRDLVATGKVDFAAGVPPAVYQAVIRDNPEFVPLLLELGAGPNVPYMRKERWDDRQAYISVYDSSDYDSVSPASPLFAAARLDKTDVARALVQAGAQVAAIELPLLCAAQKGNLELAELLLTSKIVEINAVNAAGRSALHYAAENSKPEMVKFLLDHGANPNVPDKKGVTPTALAQQFCLKDVFDLMRSVAPTQNVIAPAQNAVAPAQNVILPARSAAAPAETPAPAAMAPSPVKAPPTATGAANEAASPAEDSGETWTLSGKIVLAHTLELPEIRRRLTEIFNFTSRERLIITENLSLRSEIMGPPESFDNISEDSLTRAFAQFRRLGGVEDETAVFRSRRTKLTAKPA